MQGNKTRNLERENSRISVKFLVIIFFLKEKSEAFIMALEGDCPSVKAFILRLNMLFSSNFQKLTRAP